MINIKNKENQSQNNTILKEIKYLRGMQNFLIDTRNSNRYRVLVKESIGQTAYCFSTPIYNDKTQSLVHTRFTKSKNGFIFKGSTGVISIYQNRCIFENHKDRCIISLPNTPKINEDKNLSEPFAIVSPTLCGLRFTIKGNRYNIRLISETKQEGIHFNPLCFSIMQEKFRPFLSLASLYAQDDKGIFVPVEMEYQDRGNQAYDISLFHSGVGGCLTFEINLYEPKLFQDTTVGSAHPDTNNAYGAVAFIGKTKQLGEQWLYSRTDFSKLSDIISDRIEKVLLHIPILNESAEAVDVFTPEKRFCSFGSTWNKKVDALPQIIDSNNNRRYLTIDTTTAFVNRTDHSLNYNEGLILKKCKNKNNFIAISTGDCYSAPQILEIKFKN